MILAALRLDTPAADTKKSLLPLSQGKINVGSLTVAKGSEVAERGKAPIAFRRSDMAIHFNHTILSAHDSKASAIFLAEMLNLPAPRR